MDDPWGFQSNLKGCFFFFYHADPCLADENSPVMDTSEIDPPPIDTCHLGYEKGKATAKTKSSSACFKKDTKKTSSKSRSQVLPVVLWNLTKIIKSL